jgi:hypothetical protein
MREDKWTCRACGYRMDAYSELYEPQKGYLAKTKDLSLCLNCGTLYERRDQKWERMTPAKIRELPAKLRRELRFIERNRKIVIREDLAFKQKLKDG